MATLNDSKNGSTRPRTWARTLLTAIVCVGTFGATSPGSAADTTVVVAGLSDSSPAAPSSSEAVMPDLSARGLIRPLKEVALSAEFSTKVSKMPFSEGARFKRGQLLVAFDCSHFRAQTNAAWAAYRATKETHSANVELDQYKAVGKRELRRSEADVKRTAAEARALEARTRRCKITAPFAGVVVEQGVHPHEVPSSNQMLLRIMDDSNLELDLVVPSIWLRWLKVGVQFSFLVDETGTEHEAKVKRIGAQVDAVSQTVKLVATFTERPKSVLPGMSGSAHFASSVQN